MYQSMLVRSGRSALATFSAIFALVLAGGGLLIAPSMALAAATVTPASGGTNISIDTTSATGGSNTFTELSGPGITEQVAGDIDEGTHTVTLPAGWVFDTASPITVSKIGNIGLASTNITPGATSFEFTITSVSTNTSILIFNGIEVKPTGTDPSTNSGNMTYSGAGIVGVTPGEGGTNFGTLSTVASTVAKVVFETQPGNAVYGSLLSSQPVVKTQDQFGNDSVVGLGTSKIVTLSLSSGTGNLLNTFSLDIGTSAGNGTVTFTNVTVDTFGAGKQLTASADSLTPAISTAFEITKKTLTATITADSKPYDGNNSATFTNPIPVEVAFSDVLTLSGGPSTSATFADANAGPGKTVTATGLTLVGDKADNYTYDGTATGTANITQLTVTGSFTTENKVYNGNTTATVLSQSLSGVLAGDSENVALTGGTASFADANVGTGITVTASGMSLSGSASGNYSLTSVDTEVADITPAPLTVTADAKSKVYGAVDPALTYTHGALAGSDTEAVFAGSLARAVGENVGTYAITQGTLFAGSNYTVSFTGANLTITQKPLTVSFTTNANKTYNGNATADITGRSLVGVINPEIVGVTGGSASFADKDVGPSKTVTATGFTLTGADKDNYVIGTINTTTGNVNPRPITITAQTDTKIYDATADSDVTPVITSSFSPAVATVDSALFTQAYDNKNVGTGKTLTPSGTVTDGNGGANYTITLTPVSTGEITQAPLTATVIVEKKVIDGNNSATITSVTPSGILLSDVVTVNSQGTATFANATVGTHSVSSTGVTITGADAGNYDFNGTATGTGEILAVPTVVYVDDNWAGTGVVWTDPDGTGPATYFGYDAFATIQEAIEAVASSGTVNVAAGTYVESVTINKSLTIQRGAGALTKPIIQANDSWGFKLLGATNITVDGFEIQITGGGSANDQAVRLENADGAVIKKNTIATTADTALGIWTCGTDSGCASSDNVNINNNAITIGGVATGIYAEQVNGAHTGWSITDNIIVANAGVPLELYDVTDSTVDDNTLDGSTTNSNTIWSSQRADISDLVFTNNIVSDSSGSMVAFLSDFLLLGDGLDNTVISGVDISGNTFQDWGARGLRIGSGVTTVTVNENKFLGTGEALKNEDAASVNAEENWWGTAVVATIDGKTNGVIDFEPYYVGSGMNILSDVPVTAVYVDDNYSDGAGNDGHYFGYDAFATIQDGIDAVASSGTVNVAVGTYPESLTVDKDVSIVGSGATTVISPAVDQNGFFVTASTTIQNLKINLTTSGVDAQAIRLEGADNVTISGNTIETTGNRGLGIWIGGTGYDNSNNLTITGNTITVNNESTGIYAEGGATAQTGWHITSNTITANNGNPIELYDVTNSEVSGNTLTTTASGGSNVMWFAELSNLANLVFSNNIVSGSSGSEVAIGTDFRNDGPFADSPAKAITTVTVSGNTFSNWGSRALRIGQFGIGTVSGVTVSSNKFLIGTQTTTLTNTDASSVNAEANWWGSATGPVASTIVGTVDYRPWYTNAELTGLDSSSPTPAITSSAGSLTNVSPIPFSVAFGEGVTGFEVGDVTVGNGTKSNFAGSGAAYTFEVTPAGQGAVTVDIAGSVAEDASGNYNNAAAQFSVTYDNTTPTVTLTEDHADTIVRDADTVVVTATFNEAMASSPTITINAVADDVTGVAMTNTSGNVWTYSWNVPSGNDGSAVVTVAGTDTAGNAYAGTDSLTFTIDNTAPAVAITQPTVNSRVNATKVITFTDGESTTPQCSIDNSVWVTCTSGTTTLGNVTGFGALTDGNVTLYLRDTDTAGNIGTASVALVKDTSAPIVDSHTPSINAVNVETDTITIVFNEAVNVSTGQITVSPATAVTISSGSGTDTITLNTPSLESNTVYTVTVTADVEDLAGNAIAEYDWSFTTATLYNVALNAGNGGWNLISLPIVPIDTDISTVLGDAEDSILAVWTYDPTSVYADLENDGWFVYYPDNATLSSPSFESMTAGYGYWISVTEDTNISGSGSLLTAGPTLPPSRTLASGWSLVGYYQIPGDDSSSMEDAFSSIGVAALDYTSLWGFDNTEGEFTGVNQTSPDAILPGEAFWIAVSPNGGKNYTPSNL